MTLWLLSHNPRINQETVSDDSVSPIIPLRILQFLIYMSVRLFNISFRKTVNFTKADTVLHSPPYIQSLVQSPGNQRRHMSTVWSQLGEVSGLLGAQSWMEDRERDRVRDRILQSLWEWLKTARALSLIRLKNKEGYTKCGRWTRSTGITRCLLNIHNLRLPHRIY